MKILHAFADTGVESYVLEEYGDVTRLGINPDTGLRDIMNFEGANEIIQADGTQMPFEKNTFDISLNHPPCTPFTNFAKLNEARWGTEIPEPIIGQAREEIKRVSKHYIIENKLEAPIRKDIVLEGSMFGVPYKKERAFECSFNPGKPPEKENCTYESEFKATKLFAMKSKGYPDLWSGQEAHKASIPAPYIRFLMDRFIELF